MRAPFLFIVASALVVASCGRPNTPTHQNQDSESDAGQTSSLQASAIPATGGRAVSADGIFSVIIAPLTFDELVTIEIETLDERAAEGERGVFGLYRVRFSDEHGELEGLPATHSVRVEFTMAQEQLDGIGIEDMLVTYRTEESGEATGELEPRYLDGKVWATSNRLLADFGLLRTDEVNSCACNTDESCTEGCVCDPDCEGNDSGTTNPGTGNGDNPDNTGSGSTTSCEDWEFACADQSQCIPEIYLCDGSAQCNDESDESPSTCQGSGNNPVGGDQYEPDNDFSDASEIEPGETQTRSLPSGDGDFVRFDLTETRDVTINATPQGMNLAVIQVYDAEFNQMATSAGGSSDFFSESNSSTVNPVLESGTYFIYASSRSEPVGPYTLEVTTRAPLEPGPTNLSATQQGPSVILSWDSLEGAVSYNVYYGEYPGGPYNSPFMVAAEGTSPLSTTETTQALSGLPEYIEVYAVVRGVDENGVETYQSNEASIMVMLSADPYEPDNSQQSASAFGEGPLDDGSYAQTHSAHETTDTDWVSFELAGPANISATLTSTAYADAELFLYDADGTELSYGYFNDLDGPEPQTSVSATDLQAGTYYLMSRPYQGWYTYNSYLLTLTVELSGPVVGPADSYEEDDSIELVAESTLHLLRSGEPQTRSIHQAGDVDFARFVLDTESNIILQTQASTGDTVMKLFDASGALLQTDDETQSMSRIARNEMPAGTYFVSVTSQSTPEYLESYTLSLDAFGKPAAPQNVAVTPNSGMLVVSWPALSGATQYKVYYQYSNNPPFQMREADEGSSPLSVSSNSTTLSGLPTDAPTYVCVAALNGTAEGECSETVSGTPHGN